MKRVSYDVDGETVRAALYEPPGVRTALVPLVLLAHGLASCRTEWYDFPQKLAAAGYAVLAPDFRGHGESDGERGVQSKERFTADLQGAIEASTREFRIDTGRVALLGHSLGAALSVCAAPHLPLRCLIALSPPARLRDEITPLELAGYRALRVVNSLVVPLHKSGLRVPYKVDYKRLYSDPAAVERARKDAFLQTTIPIKNYRALVAKLDARVCARNVRVPTLVMVAEWDVVVGRYNTRKVYAALPQPKKWVEVPRSGHSMCGDARSDFVAAHCIEFLHEHLRGPA